MGVDFSWQPIFLLSGNLPVVRAFFGSFPKDWLVPKYAHLIQAILARYMAKKGQERPFWAISESGGSKLVEQSGTRVEQGRAYPWWCIETVSLVREGHMGAPEGPQSVQNCQKRPFWAISGSGGSKLVEQSGTRVEQGRAYPRWCIETVSLVREGHMGVHDKIDNSSLFWARPILSKSYFTTGTLCNCSGRKKCWIFFKNESLQLSHCAMFNEFFR